MERSTGEWNVNATTIMANNKKEKLVYFMGFYGNAKDKIIIDKLITNGISYSQIMRNSLTEGLKTVKKK